MRDRFLSFLRPHLFKECKPVVKATAAHARFFSAVARRSTAVASAVTISSSNDVNDRVKELKDAGPLDSYYPRSNNERSWMSVSGFRRKFAELKNDELDTSQLRTLKGTHTMRHVGR